MKTIIFLALALVAGAASANDRMYSCTYSVKTTSQETPLPRATVTRLLLADGRFHEEWRDVASGAALQMTRNGTWRQTGRKLSLSDVYKITEKGGREHVGNIDYSLEPHARGFFHNGFLPGQRFDCVESDDPTGQKRAAYRDQVFGVKQPAQMVPSAQTSQNAQLPQPSVPVQPLPPAQNKVVKDGAPQATPTVDQLYICSSGAPEDHGQTPDSKYTVHRLFLANGTFYEEWNVFDQGEDRHLRQKGKWKRVGTRLALTDVHKKARSEKLYAATAGSDLDLTLYSNGFSHHAGRTDRGELVKCAIDKGPGELERYKSKYHRDEQDDQNEQQSIANARNPKPLPYDPKTIKLEFLSIRQQLLFAIEQSDPVRPPPRVDQSYVREVPLDSRCVAVVSVAKNSIRMHDKSLEQIMRYMEPHPAHWYGPKKALEIDLQIVKKYCKN